MVDVILAKLDNEVTEYLMAPPFGILYLADALEKAGFGVRLFHQGGSQADIQALVRLVLAESPIFVGFSTLTGPMISSMAQASRAIKQVSPVPVVWGGLHPTMLPEQSLENDFIDVVAIGEGEETIVELARVLRDHGPGAQELAQVAGIAFKRDGHVVKTSKRPFIQDLDRYRPAWHLVDIERYFRSGQHFYTDIGSQFWGEKIAAVFTSRGCPWRCAFCYNQFVNKRSFRARSAGSVVDEIQEYKERYGVTAIIFEDDGFFTNKERALEIVRRIGVPWTSSIRANYLAKWGDDFVRELRQHHCFELRIGAESGSPRVLEIMDKDITVEQIREAARVCLRNGVKPSLGFMLGTPGETWSDVQMTLDLMDELEAMGDGIAVVGPCIFTPFPGTPLFEEAVKRGFEPPETLEEWSIRVWDHKQPLAPYVDPRIRFVGYYRRLAQRSDMERLTFSLPTRILSRIARSRWRHRFFQLPLDYTLPAFGLDLLVRIGSAGTSSKLRRAMWKQ
ncbi:MAG: radical SAM protein [Anaerolineae bacterium]|jgi:anaerobic magnesium-protoporphyrin IX monomethyl ester cyclase